MNPVALGTRWLAYSEQKLIPEKQSKGGSDGHGYTTYGTTLVNAAKSLGKGFRGISEKFAVSMFGSSGSNASTKKPDIKGHCGFVTIIDIKV